MKVILLPHFTKQKCSNDFLNGPPSAGLIFIIASLAAAPNHRSFDILCISIELQCTYNIIIVYNMLEARDISQSSADRMSGRHSINIYPMLLQQGASPVQSSDGWVVVGNSTPASRGAFAIGCTFLRNPTYF